MTLLDAKVYDEAAARRRRNRKITAAVIAVVAITLTWLYRNWPEERIVDHFFQALQKKDYETAYGIWWHDPDWRQHPERYSKKYPFNEFYRDWGPGGDWGLIKSYKICASGAPPGPAGSGIIVEVIVNERAEHARLWVEKSDKTLSFSPD